MENKELIERLRIDAEWAEGQEWETPICLWDDLREAISALRAQQEAEKNDPLTLEELRELDGEPIWVDGQGYCFIDGDCVYIPVGQYCGFELKNYGDKWLAYRRKPEELAMERLTFKDAAGRWVLACNRLWHWFENKYPAHIRGEAIDRLAAYEDTGLEPEEVEQLKGEVFGLKMDKQELEKYRALGHIDHLRELAQAEKDGWLVVAPCKVGDIVFDIADGTAYATRVLSFSYFGDHWACRTVSSYPDLEQFGTRIFLTREKAEAALKGGVEG